MELKKTNNGKNISCYDTFQIDILNLPSPYQNVSCLSVCKIDNLVLMKIKIQGDKNSQHNIEK